MKTSRREIRLNRLYALREQGKAAAPAIVAKHEVQPIVIVAMTEVR